MKKGDKCLKGKETNLPNDDYLLRFGAQNLFFKDTFSFNHNFMFYNFKSSFKYIFIKKNYLKWKVINLFLILDVIAFKKTIVLIVYFLNKITSRLKKLTTNFEEKTGSRTIVPWTIAPGQFPPGQLPPRIIAPWTIPPDNSHLGILYCPRIITLAQLLPRAMIITNYNFFMPIFCFFSMAQL